MPIPKPSSDNYGSPSDAGIMGEDYQNDQARFHEATDKELEAFQKEMRERNATTGKEEPEPSITVGDVQQALIELGQISSESWQKALVDLRLYAAQKKKEEGYREEPDTVTAEGVAKILGDFANRSSTRTDKELVEELGTLHRTIQQAITRLFVMWMRHLHGHWSSGDYDDRNEASVMLAHAMFEDIAPEKLHLPLI